MNMKLFYDEQEILNEKPYSGVKHFVYMIPEMLSFCLKVGIGFAVLFAFTTVTLDRTYEMVMTKLPQFCASYHP